ncbi:MAG: uroporphyrinogen decarboxylase [Deltaproteobacteria bacterium]|nr:uroporphyrinogen decarboxylase [Deltaproteobacteria bacterium]
MSSPLDDSLFLRACRGEATPRPPLWMMRQAGRYLPEYRQIREKVSFLELCKTPRLAAEVTLQPIRRFGFDAAILFSDLLVPLEAMGLAVEFTEQGPRLPAPLRTPDDMNRIQAFDPAKSTDFVLETIRLAREGLGTTTPLIGFAGAPFTVATYAIEGKTAKNFLETKKLFYRHPALARQLLALIGRATQTYLEAQIAAGVAAVQLFDSWVGVVSTADWNEFVFEPTAALITALRATGVPVIYFGNGATTILDRIAALGADVYGIDWRLPLDEARSRIATTHRGTFAVQGNLDPAVLLGPVSLIERRAADVVARGGRHGHVFNLGHGITPETPIESVEALVRVVKES